MGKTSIAWTDEVWNPITGCSLVSPGCDHCYASRMAQRLCGRFGYPADEPFRVTLHPERLEEPLRWRKPRRIFVCSMGDLFHRDVPWTYIDDVFDVMHEASQHTFMLLTKRPGRMAYYARTWLRAYPWPRNVWAGTSVESAQYLPRLDVLRKVPAPVRFVSAEPLLGPLPRLWLGMDDWSTGWRAEHILHWVIVGGESGPGARPMQIEWLEDIVAQCREAGVPCWVKQDSGLRPGQQGRIPDALWRVKEMP